MLRAPWGAQWRRRTGTYSRVLAPFVSVAGGQSDRPSMAVKPSDVAAQERSGARRPGGMYAAFGLLRTRPAPGPHIISFFRRTGAWPAADRREPCSDQRMRREIVFGGVGIKLGLAPGGERIELHLLL